MKQRIVKGVCDLKLSGKIFAGFTLVALIPGAVGIIGIMSMKTAFGMVMIQSIAMIASIALGFFFSKKISYPVEQMADEISKSRIKIDYLNNIPTPIVSIDKDYNIIYMNNAGAKLVGLTPKECEGRKCFEMFKTPHCHTSECRCHQAMEQDGVFVGETTANPNGLAIPIQYTAVPVKDRDGTIVGALEYVVDITNLKQAIDDALTKVQYLNKIPTPVMVVDKDFNVQFMNQAGAQAVGRTPEGCMGQKCFSLFNTKHCNTAECRVAKAIREDGVFTGDTVANLPTGELPIRYSAAPIKDADGNLVGAMEYVIDISEEYQAVDEIRNLSMAAVEGRLDARANPAKYNICGFRDVAQGINDTLDAVIEPIKEASAVLQNMAEGDLRVRVTGNYKGDHAEIKNALNMFLEKIGEMIGQVKESSNMVANAANETSLGNQDLSQRTEEQASSLEEISSTIEEVAASLQKSSEGAHVADSNSKGTLEIVRKGEIVVNELHQAMREITNGSRAIAEIIAKVNDIAFQTNLLALNAAVEAARAGEQGRGFAVVAAEVRNLAGRTAESSREIEGLIKESLTKVDHGNNLMEETTTVLKNIVDNTQETADVIAEIASSIHEQSGAADDIRTAVEQLNQVTQQNASLVEEIAGASEALNNEAEELTSLVSLFKTNETSNERNQANGRMERAKRMTDPRKEAHYFSDRLVAAAGEPKYRMQAERMAANFNENDFEKF